MEDISKYIYKIFNIREILKWIENNFLLFVLGILIILFYKKITKTIIKIVDRILLSKMTDVGVQTFFKSIIKISVHIIMFYLIVMLLGIDFTSVFAILGAISVVVGFAFKEIIQNIFGGLILLIFKPFKVGDVIQYANYIGSVTKIEMFYTKIVNFQNEVVIIPNGILIVHEVRNITTQNKRRLDLIIGVDYSSNLALAKKVINEVVNGCEYVLKDEPITIGVGELAESSINFITNVYVLPENYLITKLYILENIKYKFDEFGISIPFNQLDIHIKEGKKD